MVNLWLIIGITIYLVGGDWNMNCIFFHSVGNGIIIPTDELTPSFFRGVGTTTNQLFDGVIVGIS